MTLTDDWTEDEISALTSEDEIHVSSIRRDGSARPPVTVWMVTDGGSVYVRAVKGVDGPWYRHVRTTDHAHVTARGVTTDVAVEDASEDSTFAGRTRCRLPGEVPALRGGDSRQRADPRGQGVHPSPLTTSLTLSGRSQVRHRTMVR